VLGDIADFVDTVEMRGESARRAEVDHQIRSWSGAESPGQCGGCRHLADTAHDDVDVGRQVRGLLGERHDDQHGWQASDVSRRRLVSWRPGAPLLVLGAVASVQSGAAVATRLFPVAGPGGTVLLRLAIAALLLMAVARPDVRGRDRSDIVAVVLFGLVLAGMNATFYEALSRIPLGVAVTFEFIGPLALALLGSRRLVDLLWVALAALGVGLLSSAGGSLDTLGIVLALAAGGFWAGYILLAKRVGASFPGAGGLALALCVGAVAMAPFGIVTGGRRLWHAGVLGRGAAVAVLSSAVPYTLELSALRRLRASVFGVLMSLEPAFAAISGLVLLGQHLRLREWLAVVSVMVASVGATRAERPRPHPGATPAGVVA
jgi:inner membrane transporter RhtA